MKIILCDHDNYFVNRLAEMLKKRMQAEVNICDIAVIPEMIENNIADVYIIPESIGIKNNLLNIIYITEDKNSKCVYKYMTVTEWIKKVESVYSYSHMYNISNVEISRNKIIAFCSMGGGMGNTTLALSTASHLAHSGRKILYIDLKNIVAPKGIELKSSEISIEKLLGDYKSRTGNMYQILSTVPEDKRGFKYISNFELNMESGYFQPKEVNELLCVILNSKMFDQIIIDCRVESEIFREIMTQEKITIGMVTDGNNISNNKLIKVMNYISKYRRISTDNIKIIYNKFAGAPNVASNVEAYVIGGVSRIQDENTALNKISSMDFMDRLSC